MTSFFCSKGIGLLQGVAGVLFYEAVYQIINFLEIRLECIRIHYKHELILALHPCVVMNVRWNLEYSSGSLHVTSMSPCSTISEMYRCLPCTCLRTWYLGLRARALALWLSPNMFMGTIGCPIASRKGWVQTASVPARYSTSVVQGQPPSAS